METSVQPTAPFTVFYDHSCPVCRSELSALDLESHGFELRDCSASDFVDKGASACGITREAMMEAIHLRDAKGNWFQGVDAFEIIYRRAGYPWLADWLARPGLRPMHDRLYAFVAKNRKWIGRLGLHHPMGVLVRRSQSRKRAAGVFDDAAAGDSASGR